MGGGPPAIIIGGLPRGSVPAVRVRVGSTTLLCSVLLPLVYDVSLFVPTVFLTRLV